MGLVVQGCGGRHVPGCDAVMGKLDGRGREGGNDSRLKVEVFEQHCGNDRLRVYSSTLHVAGGNIDYHILCQCSSRLEQHSGSLTHFDA